MFEQKVPNNQNQIISFRYVFSKSLRTRTVFAPVSDSGLTNMRGVHESNENHKIYCYSIWLGRCVVCVAVSWTKRSTPTAIYISIYISILSRVRTKLDVTRTMSMCPCPIEEVILAGASASVCVCVQWKWAHPYGIYDISKNGDDNYMKP